MSDHSPTTDVERELSARLHDAVADIEAPAMTPSTIRALAAAPVDSERDAGARPDGRLLFWAAAAAAVVLVPVGITRLGDGADQTGPAATPPSVADGPAASLPTPADDAAAPSPTRSTVAPSPSQSTVAPADTGTDPADASAPPGTPGAVAPVSITVAAPSVDGTVAADSAALVVAGSAASSDSRLAAIRVVVQDLDSRLYLQADGEFSRDWHYFEADFTTDGREGWHLETPPLPTGSYELRARAIDVAGDRTEWSFVTFEAR